MRRDGIWSYVESEGIMRSQAEIETYIRDLLCEALDKRLEEAAKQLPHQCVHNYRHTLDLKREHDGMPNEGFNTIASPHAQNIGLCVYGSEDPTTWNGNVCEDPSDAKGCPYYKAKQTPKEIREEFLDNIANVPWLMQNLPVPYILLWTIGEYGVNRGVNLPWWWRAWRWLRRGGMGEMVLMLPPAEGMEKWLDRK